MNYERVAEALLDIVISRYRQTAGRTSQGYIQAKRYKLTEEEKTQVVSLYAQGEPTRDIALRLHKSLKTIQELLRERGVMRHVGRRRSARSGGKYE